MLLQDGPQLGLLGLQLLAQLVNVGRDLSADRGGGFQQLSAEGVTVRGDGVRGSLGILLQVVQALGKLNPEGEGETGSGSF